MTKHTPGPWVAECVGDTGGENPADVYMVFTADGYAGIAGAMSEGNARLIAAAPDLLAAVNGYMAWADPEICHDDELNAILESFRAAIAKATGGE